jgi:5S rRNA maturation endonuclease (ribonuclease M5)
MARCPAHPDSTPSLSISVGTDQPVVFNCHAGCDPDLILDALGLTWAEVSNDLPERTGKAEILDTYDYVDEAGELLYQVVRYVPKDFRQRRPNGTGGWDWKLGDTLRPLYRLPEVLAAVESGDPIFVCEGEKDVDAVRRAGFTATCNSGGAGKWLPHHTQTLAGAVVVVVADRDRRGRTHARDVAAALDGVAITVRCAEAIQGKDVADHLSAGHSVSELAEVLDRWEADLAEEQPATGNEDPGPTPGPEPWEEDVQQGAVARLRSLLLDGTTVKLIQARRSLVKGWLDLNSLAVLYGRSGGGKSFIAIDLALCIVTGTWWKGHKVRKGTVLYVVAEGATGIADRQTAWQHHNRHHPDPDGIYWLPRPVNLLDVVAAEALIQVAAELQPVLVVIDTLARSMSGGDENAGKDMSRVIEAADRIKIATGACVLVVHHSGKDETRGPRGWSGLKGALDTELELLSADNILILSTTKQKDDAEQQPLRLTMVPHRWTCPDCAGKGFLPDTGEECDRCDGDQEVGSVAIAKYTGQAAGNTDVSQKARDTYQSLIEIDTGSGVTMGQWLEVSGVPKSSFYRHVKTLVDAHLVHESGAGNARRYSIIRSEDGAA